MTPDFRIEVDGQDVTGNINDRLLELRITDQEGVKSDRLEFTVDDRDNLVALPRTGAKVRVWLGYRETGVSYMGLFVVDEVEISGVPEQITVRARAADMRKSLKAHKTRKFENTTIGGVVNRIAGEHGLRPVTGGHLASVKLPYLGQTEESDMHLLTRLARRYDATFKVADGKLVFTPRGEGKTASGKPMRVSLSRTGLISWTATIKERPRHKAVKARWHDRGQARARVEKAGDGEPAFKLRHEYPSRGEARAAARAKKQQLARGEGALNCETSGNPAIAAGAQLTVSGVRDGVDGDWVIKTATHALDSQSGYRTTVEAEKKT
jgi:phage protein D